MKNNNTSETSPDTAIPTRQQADYAEICTAQDLAKATGYTDRTIRNLADRGVIPVASNIGGHRRFDRQAALAALAGNHVPRKKARRKGTSKSAASKKANSKKPASKRAPAKEVEDD